MDGKHVPNIFQKQLQMASILPPPNINIKHTYPAIPQSLSIISQQGANHVPHIDHNSPPWRPGIYTQWWTYKLLKRSPAASPILQDLGKTWKNSNLQRSARALKTRPIISFVGPPTPGKIICSFLLREMKEARSGGHRSGQRSTCRSTSHYYMWGIAG